jgi:hypothetical protein
LVSASNRLIAQFNLSIRKAKSSHRTSESGGGAVMIPELDLL